MASVIPPVPNQPEPAWEIARLFPPQGQWSETRYLSFTEDLNQLVELVAGRVEVLEMPTKSHQKVVQHLLNLFVTFLTSRGLGDAISAPYRVRLMDGNFREPDVVVYRTEHLDRFGERYGDGADLVVEVVSEDDASRSRDYIDKRREYAASGIPEYWIVDPFEKCVRVLHLDGDTYAVAEEFGIGDEAKSVILPDLSVSVTDIFAAGAV